MLIPDHLVYAETHEWVRVEGDGTLVVGITDFGQEQLGTLVYVDLPAVGKQLKRRGECGIVESNKTASDLHAPVARSWPSTRRWWIRQTPSTARLTISGSSS
jgi:glycine cleavage system H protein